MNKSALFFFVILLFGLVLGIYLVLQKTNLLSKADISLRPEKLTVSNVSDNSFTVSFITKKPIIGFVSFGNQTENLENIALDDRDTSNNVKERYTHHITLKNLSPETSYFYQINSGILTADDNGKPFEQKTAPTTAETPPLPLPVFGKAIGQDSIVYLKMSNATLVSSFLREEGKWLITANNARTNDLQSYVSVKKGDSADLIFEDGIRGTITKKIILDDQNPVLLESEESKKETISVQLQTNKEEDIFSKIKRMLGL